MATGIPPLSTTSTSGSGSPIAGAISNLTLGEAYAPGPSVGSPRKPWASDARVPAAHRQVTSIQVVFFIVIMSGILSMPYLQQGISLEQYAEGDHVDVRVYFRVLEFELHNTDTHSERQAIGEISLAVI